MGKQIKLKMIDGTESMVNSDRIESVRIGKDFETGAPCAVLYIIDDNRPFYCNQTINEIYEMCNS